MAMAAAAAAVNSIAAFQRFRPLSRPTINTPIIASVKDFKTHLPNLRTSSSSSSFYLPPPINRGSQTSVVRVATEDVIPVHSNDPVEQQQQDVAASAAGRAESDEDSAAAAAAAAAGNTPTTQVAAFALESGGGRSGGGAFPSSSPQTLIDQLEGGEDFNKMADRAINAAILLAAGTFAITKLLTIDSDYWHGWTLYEILRYAPLHNWSAYEEALKTNPILAKMMISGVVYSLGDWIAQCYEGKPLFDFDRTRMFRSGLVGFTLHGSLSHYYYYFCEALFPSQDWWVVPAKVLFDQTAWAAIWNSIYYVVLGFLRFESPINIFSELKATFWPMLTAGWKLWPFAHLVTYGVIPVEHRLLWVDCVELVWVTILSTYSNEKSEARHLESTSGPNTRSVEE